MSSKTMNDVLKKALEDLNKEHKLTDDETKYLDIAQKSYKKSQAYFDGVLTAKIIRRNNMVNSVHDSDSDYVKPDNEIFNRHYIPKTQEWVKNGIAQFLEAYNYADSILTVAPEIDTDIVDIVAAELYQYLADTYFRSNNNNLLDFVHNTVDSGLTHNFCAGKIDYDLDKKHPTLIPIAIEDIRFDENASPSDIVGTSPFVIHIIEMYVWEILTKQKKDGWKTVNVKDLLVCRVDSVSNNNSQIDASRDKDGIGDKFNATSGVDSHTKVYVHENFVKDEEGNVKVFYTAQDKCLLSDVMDLEDLYPHGMPFVIGHTFKEPKKTYPASALDHARPVQLLMNDFTNRNLDILDAIAYPVNAIKANKHFNINQLKDKKFWKFIEMGNPKEDWQQIIPQFNPAGFQNELPTFAAQYDSVVGGYSNSSAAISNSGGGTATEANMKYASNSGIVRLYMTNYGEGFFELCARKWMDCYKCYLAEDSKLIDKIFKKLQFNYRFDKLLAQQNQINGENRTLKVNKEFLETELIINSNVGKESANPQMRFERTLAGVNAIQSLSATPSPTLNTKEVTKTLLKLIGIPNPNLYIIDTVDPEITRRDQRIQELEQENQKLAAKQRTPEEIAAAVAKDNATTQRAMKEIESMSIKDKLELAKTITEMVKAQDLATQVGMTVAGIPESAPVADAILNNAGFVDPTPQDSIIPQNQPQIPGFQNESSNQMFVDTHPMLVTPPANPTGNV